MKLWENKNIDLWCLVLMFFFDVNDYVISEPFQTFCKEKNPYSKAK